MKQRALILFAVLSFEVYCMSHVVVSPATINDVAQIASVHAASWHAEFAELLPENVVKKMSYEFCKDFWRTYFQNQNSDTEAYVAKMNGKVVGFVAILTHSKPNKAYDCEIDKIYVSPEYQGLGIGSQLMKQVLKVLHEKGFKKVVVKVFIKNTKAQKFYEKIGGVHIKDEDIVDYHSVIRVKVYGFNL